MRAPPRRRPTNASSSSSEPSFTYAKSARRSFSSSGISRASRLGERAAARLAHLRRRGERDDLVVARLAAGLVEQRNLDDDERRRLGRRDLVEPVRRCARATRGCSDALEPVQLGAVGEHDRRDGRAVDLAVRAEDAVAPALAQLRLEALVLAVDAVHELVGRGDGGAAAFERRERLGLAGRDTPRDRDRERPPAH